MNNKAETELEDIFKGLAFIGFVIAIITYPYISNINYYLPIFWLWTIALLAVAVVYLFLFGLTHISIKSGEFVFNKATYKIKKKKYEARFIQNETIEIENLILETLATDEQTLTRDIERLRNKMSISRHYKEFSHFIPQLKERLVKARERLEEARKEQYSKNLSEEIEIKEQKNKNLEEEIKEKERQRLYQEEVNERIILRKLNAEENYVFEKDKLNKREIGALLRNGYLIYSEYCIINKKLINLLIKKKLNHSPTHIFLVWNTINLLKNIKGVKNIREHLSVDADLTFRFEGKLYALEIETGTLLKKTKQKQEKVDYNNKKYKDRWMFIVSNRNLMKEYNKLGFATQRKGVSKNIAKMLKITHPF
ncbi:MAG: hypothetical protein PHH54_01580 [Candidatus Nanoarchaeia archaeon]|nr:hypothetical protein [Candidatus Nanoarchaeia archaeon]MDD5740654.1 hypothetical protein [Candidatus Nanoarchaeia archaeon]